MAVEFIDIRDAGGTTRSVAVDAITGGFIQCLRLLVGGDGADPGTFIAAGAQLLASSLPINDTPNSAITSTAATVSTTGALLGSAATNRRYVFVFNNGTKTVYIGQSGVTNATGWPVFPGTGYQFPFGPGIAPHAVSDDGSSQDCRVMELA